MRKYSPTIRLSIQTSPITAGIRATINISTRDENHNEASGWLDWGDQSPRATWTKPSPTVLTHTYVAAGLYTITAAEHDTTRLEGIASAMIEVVPGPSVPVIVPGGPTALTITANNRSKTFGDLVTFAGTEFTTSGLLGGDTVSSVTLTSAGTPTSATVGAYAIAPSAAVGTGLTNYTITYVSGSLTVAAVPDTTAPVVTWTAPAANATVSGAVTLAVTATDAVGVVGVRFKVDGVNIGAEDLVAPFTLVWDSASVADGSHTLSAVARDAAGNTATATRSIAVLQVVSDVTAPVVTWVGPAEFTTLAGTTTLSVTATDNVAVIGVQFKADGVNVNSEVMAAPFTTTWNTTAVLDGVHTLSATARDAAGNTTTVSVSVYTQQAIVPPPDNVPPVVYFTSPASVPLTGTVSITVTATDNVAVAGVQLYVDGAPYGAELTVAPYTRTWNTVLVADGSHTLAAVARDAAGNIANAARYSTVANYTVPGAQRVLRSTDLTYLGCMRVSTGVDLTFSYGVMTGRKVAGAVQLLMTGNVTEHDPVYEFLDAGSYAADHTVAPRMTLVRNWGDIYGSSRKTWLPDGTERTGFSMYPGGYYYNEDTGLLYWTYQDVYNTTGYQDWCLGASRLDVGGAVAYGPWRPSGDGKKGPQRCLRVARQPLTGSMLCGSGVVAGNAVSPWGPDVWTGDFPTTSTPSGFTGPDIPITKYLTYYPMLGQVGSDGAFTLPIRACRRPGDYYFEPLNGPSAYTEIDPTKNGGIGTWTQVDGANGVIWIDLPDAHGVIVTGRFGADHVWYSNIGVGNYLCSHGVAPPVAITGSVSTNAYPVMMFYDPDDLTAVANSTKVDYTVDPVEITNCATTFGLHTAAISEVGSAKTISGSYFDSATRKLYVCAPQVDATNGFLNPVVHVFHIA